MLGQIATSARLRPGSRCRAASRRSSVRRPTTAAPSGLHQRAVRPCGRAGCPHPPAEGRVLPGVLAAGSRNGRSPPRVQSVITRPPTRPTPTQSRPPKLPDQPSRCRPTSAQAAHQISPFITGVQWPMIMVGTTCGPARAPRRHTSMRVCVSRGSLGRPVLGGGQDRDEPLGCEGRRVFGHAVQAIAGRWLVRVEAKGRHVVCCTTRGCEPVQTSQRPGLVNRGSGLVRELLVDLSGDVAAQDPADLAVGLALS